MRLTASQADLAATLAMVSRAVTNRHTLPILSGIHLEATGQTLTLTGTDLEIGITAPLPADVTEPGTIVLPAKYLTEIVRRLPAGPVTIEVDQSTYTATVTWDQSRYTIHGQAADQYPYFSQPSGQADYRLPQHRLRELVRQTAFAVSHDQARPILTGVLVMLQAPAITLVATDGIRIATSRGELQALSDSPTDASIVLPGRALQELSRLLASDSEGDVTVHLTDNQAHFGLGSIRLVSRLLDGQYPDVLRLIPEAYTTHVKLAAQSLQDACERAGLIAREGNNAVKLEIATTGVALSANAPEVGQVYEEIAATVSGEPLEIGLNPQLLVEGLRVIEEDEITFEFTGTRSPSRIRVTDKDDFVYVVLPMVTW